MKEGEEMPGTTELFEREDYNEDAKRRAHYDGPSKSCDEDAESIIYRVHTLQSS